MIRVNKFEALGLANHGWLESRHHFSFANYHNPDRMGFGKLRVVNDDIIRSGKGFDTHPHQNMEIITYVRQGAITHRDSVGNEGRTEAGDVQVMSAGAGIFHSEYNLESEDTILYQIWILPDSENVKPRWDQRAFPKELVTGTLNLLVSNNMENGLFIHQDAALYGGKMRAQTAISHPIVHQAYILVSEGEITLDKEILRKGDAAEATDVEKIEIGAVMDAEVIVIDVPK